MLAVAQELRELWLRAEGGGGDLDAEREPAPAGCQHEERGLVAQGGAAMASAAEELAARVALVAWPAATSSGRRPGLWPVALAREAARC